MYITTFNCQKCGFTKAYSHSRKDYFRKNTFHVLWCAICETSTIHDLIKTKEVKND